MSVQRSRRFRIDAGLLRGRIAWFGLRRWFKFIHLCFMGMLASLALAAPPAYPETAIGATYLPPASGGLWLSTTLPASPLGLETGASLELFSEGGGLGGRAELGALVFPGLTLGEHFASLGGFVRLPFAAFQPSGFATGLVVGPRASLEFASGIPLVLSTEVGVGYYRGLHLAWGLGARLYVEPVALEVTSDERLPLAVRLLFLW